MAKSPEEGLASLFKNLETQTGKSLETWIAEARATGLKKHKELVEVLKTEHDLSHGYANQIALRALAADDAPAVGSDDLIEVQYSGAKSAVRPIYDALISVIRGFGPDVEFSPKKAYVSLRRTKQFGVIQPSTATRIDLGLVLKQVEPTSRLEASGSFNAMVTHRVRVGAVAEIDAELVGWMKTAYLNG